ncbi:hypothetical protein G7013_06045 [Pseudomonas viridiflava]|uniref:Uncharacterized protein n=1 Tax=Pseudomonas viridiflava TaxID=33069 RepID=A0A3M5PBA4_PSEVI|nr:hypothetical protein [Pseudomonas viridiflava]MBA1229209.1 hypothetical protein [Pseudomonas viridiflava]RMT81555.1 hypothetical protein ALP40_03419 [Pseudomonas viridiflava]
MFKNASINGGVFLWWLYQATFLPQDISQPKIRMINLKIGGMKTMDRRRLNCRMSG